MTYREFLEALQRFVSDSPNAEALDQRVVVRVTDSEDELHVGGLSSVEIDAGCGDVEALILDADQSPDQEDDRELRP